MKTSQRPLRSVLYMPASNARALEKARTLDADGYIFDLEDAVQPDAKDMARQQALDTVNAGGFGRAIVTVRVNGIGTPWHRADTAAVAQCGADAVVLPKVNSAEDVLAFDAALREAGAPDTLELWAMIETPRAVLACEQIATAAARLTGLVMGTSDLSKDMRAQPVPGRATLFHALSHCVLVARAYGLAILDGVHGDIKDVQGLSADCAMARAMGYDGKSIVHPSHIEPANAAFSPSMAEVNHAILLIATYEAALEQGKGVAVLDGKMIESLHVEEARRLIAFAEAIAGSADT